MEKEIVPQVTTKPWRWKLWTLRFLGFLLVFLILFIWAMRRSWGEPLPGVRLEPLVKESPKDFKPGSFAAVMDDVQKEYRKHVSPQRLYPEWQLLDGRKAWKDEDFPELTKACEAMVPAFKRLAEASDLPESESKILWRSASVISDGGIEPLYHVHRLFLLQGRRDLEKGDLSAVFSTIQTIEKLSSHIVNNGSSYGRRPFLNLALPLAKRLAEKLTQEEQFVLLEETLKRLESHKMDAAETTRYMLIDFQEKARANDYDAPFGRFFAWKWAIGSDPKSVESNLKTFFSEAIQHLEKYPESVDFEPLLTKYIGRPDSLKRTYKFGPDPVSCHFAMLSVYLIERQRLEDLRTLASSHCLRADVAIRRFKFKNHRLPTTLAEALPEPILDPFTDKPLLFISKPDQPWIVYSAGPNKKDDGGSYKPKEPLNSKDLGIWSNETEQLEQSKPKPKPKPRVK